MPEAAAQLRIGLRSSPYLADHGFRDMVVLPGSFYIEAALRMEHALSKRIPALVRNVLFHHPVILSTEDTLLGVEVRNMGGGLVEYRFYEAQGHDPSPPPALRQYAATLEIDRDSSGPESAAGAFSIAAFQAQADTLIDAGQFYNTLRENGNQFGPSFQKVSSIWRCGGQSLGKLCVAHQHTQLLDAMTQLLGPFVMDEGRTFVLQSIDKLEVTSIDYPDPLWGHATLLPRADADGKGIRGNVRVFDGCGRTYLELHGVAFSLLDRVAEERAGADLVVASNFTAEPLEDSLKFWAQHFGAALQVRFAPYDQVFQQLLDAGSAFRRNADGVNVIALGLEQWAAGDRQPLISVDPEKRDRCFGARARCVLPNGLEIVHLNQYETDYLYKEIFADQCYLRHGIGLQDGDTVVDIGANIGLFSLFVMSRCKNPRIYAFEPAGIVHELLQANCTAYGSKARAVNMGVSDRPKTATFTFYEKSSVFSGFHADETEDREAIQTVVRNMLSSESIAGEAVEDCVSELTADRLRRSAQECRLTCVSDIIRENRIDEIGLLKIDAEKSELHILAGIEERDWPKIRQIVVEIHDRTGKLVERIEDLLTAKGYRCAVEQQALLEQAGFFNVYATRTAAATQIKTAPSLKRNVEDFCAALRAFMNESAVPLVLCICPRTPADESDEALRVALNDAEDTLLSEAGRIANVHAIGSASLLRRYPVKDYYDPHGHRAAHVPYTPACYAAIGTALFRTLFSLKRSPFKVIALDCDNTLWKGVCGEDGPLGIELTAPHRALQEFMVRQVQAGMLLCLCSKNNEKDALEVFEQRTDMPLKRGHLVSWRLNWESKSENLKALAKELELGLDSFILVDDNPVDCADVRVNCPEVLTLQLPQDDAALAAFLDHVWAFDHSHSTDEDQSRTRMYHESTARQRYRERSLTLKEFIEGLELRLEIVEPAAAELGRVSQLTFRTNQFNFTSVRRSEQQIRDFLKRPDAGALVVRVADRFGDYGLVGVVLYETHADCYKLDSFLLSCRVLGRGVEHAVLSALGERALKDGKGFVEIRCEASEKNAPALEFITSIGQQYRNGLAASWTFPAERLASVQYVPLETAVDPEKSPPRAGLAFDVAERCRRLQRIAEEWSDVERLAQAIEEYRRGKQAFDAAADMAQGNSLEGALSRLWRKVLGRRVGIDDSFFEAGGTSLKAVELVVMIRKELSRSVSVVSIFECPTVRLLAARLGATAAPQLGAAAALRGQRRRRNTVRRQASKHGNELNTESGT
jgi:FkbH-like protein/FkbM family methyltransferase